MTNKKQALIQRPGELEIPRMVKVLIYGQPGSKKTTLAFSAPRCLLFDFDKGAHRIHPGHLGDTVKVDSWEDVENVVDTYDLSGYDSIAYDTAGKMLDHVSAFLIKSNPKLGFGGTLNQQGYGRRKTLFRNHFHKLSTMGKKMLIFVAHEREEKDGENRILRPEIGGSSGSDLIRELDLVGYMELIGSKRTISFDPTERFYAKNSAGLAPRIELPELFKPGTNELDPKARNDFFQTVLEQFDRKSEDRAATGAAYDALMDATRDLVAGIKTPEDANAFVARMADADQIWDSKLQARQMLMERAKTLGLVLNAGKQYEVKA